jgi:hypothetical protein
MVLVWRAPASFSGGLSESLRTLKMSSLIVLSPWTESGPVPNTRMVQGYLASTGWLVWSPDCSLCFLSFLEFKETDNSSRKEYQSFIQKRECDFAIMRSNEDYKTNGWSSHSK